MTLEALTSYINFAIAVDLCIGHIFTPPQDYGTIYLIMLGESHLLTFLRQSKVILIRLLELSVIVTFVHSLDFHITSFPLIYFIPLIYFMS